MFARLANGLFRAEMFGPKLHCFAARLRAGFEAAEDLGKPVACEDFAVDRREYKALGAKSGWRGRERSGRLSGIENRRSLSIGST